MTKFLEVSVGDLFIARNGRAKFTRDYIDAHIGDWPVYSASLRAPFGFVDEYEYEGRYLTWVMNGYGGRMEELRGRFSANRDRGVLVPKTNVATPDLTYLRFAIEPQLVAAAVGRRVDGRQNEYTKIYPKTAEDVSVILPLTSRGGFDYRHMEEVGARLAGIEKAQQEVQRIRSDLETASLRINISDPVLSISLGDSDSFSLEIGQRVLRKAHVANGIPVYSANVLAPFGYVRESNLSEFAKPSLLWGIDGNFDWNLVPSGEEFATTDHCGRLQVLDTRLCPEYVFAYLKLSRSRYGFDRVFRASLKNVKSEISVVVPIDRSGAPSIKRQKQIATEFQNAANAQREALGALDEILKARLAAEL